MKNLIKITFVFAAAIVILASCNKEKAAVKKLEGTWMLKSVEASVTGETCGSAGVDTSETTLTFVAYDVKDAESGAVTLTSKAGPNSQEFSVTGTYAVSEKAETFTISFTGVSFNYTIESLSKSEFVYSQEDSITVITDCNTFATETSLGTYTYTAEKQ